MSKFNFIKTDIPDVQIIEPTVFGDDRGYFMETYQIDEFAAAGIGKPFVQDNQSRSTKGVLRGLHFQTKHTQGKLVRVTLGEVFDVAVDCRPNSKTFGKWVGATLSADNKKMLWIPEASPTALSCCPMWPSSATSAPTSTTPLPRAAFPTMTRRSMCSGPTAAASTRPAPRTRSTPRLPPRSSNILRNIEGKPCRN